MAMSKARIKRDHLKTMERRRDFLVSQKETPMYNSWVAAELKATEYVISLIQAEIEKAKQPEEK